MAVRRSAYCACVALLVAPGARAAPVLVLGHAGARAVGYVRRAIGWAVPRRKGV